MCYISVLKGSGEYWVFPWLCWGSNFDLMYRYFILACSESRLQTWQNHASQPRKRSIFTAVGRWGGEADHYKPPLAFYYCLHTLALQYRTASATETVTGTTFFFTISQWSRRQVIGVKVGLHNAVFYGFPYKLRPKPRWRLKREPWMLPLLQRWVACSWANYTNSPPSSRLHTCSEWLFEVVFINTCILQAVYLSFLEAPLIGG